MRLIRKGQSTTELAMIFILVMLGIVIAGPYVLRSINAHFKLWDDSTQDSFDDRLLDTKTPETVAPCMCNADIDGGCGPAGGCQLTERYKAYNCSPAGCKPGGHCMVDDSCCDTPTRGGPNRCWRSSADTPQLGTYPPADPTYHLSCGPTDRVFQYNCGANAGLQVCATDTTTSDGDRDCTPVCNSLPTNSTACPVTPNLSDDGTYNIVPVCTGNASNCEALCNPGTTQVGNTCVLIDCGSVPTSPGASQTFSLSASDLVACKRIGSGDDASFCIGGYGGFPGGVGPIGGPTDRTASSKITANTTCKNHGLAQAQSWTVLPPPGGTQSFGNYVTTEHACDGCDPINTVTCVSSYCGDANCDDVENCSNCAGDCRPFDPRMVCNTSTCNLPSKGWECPPGTSLNSCPGGCARVDEDGTCMNENPAIPCCI